MLTSLLLKGLVIVALTLPQGGCTESDSTSPSSQRFMPVNPNFDAKEFVANALAARAARYVEQMAEMQTPAGGRAVDEREAAVRRTRVEVADQREAQFVASFNTAVANSQTFKRDVERIAIELRLRTNDASDLRFPPNVELGMKIMGTPYTASEAHKIMPRLDR